MIAKNYRKHPDALALQLPLPFGHLLKWALPRPGSRILRAIRAKRASTFAAVGRVSYPEKKRTPAWVIEAQHKARALSNLVREACLCFVL